jgi:hypothetical protein
MATNKNNFIDTLGRNATPLLLLAGGAIAYFKIIRPLINKISDPFGKGEQHKDDIKQIEQLKNENYFDPEYKNNLKQNNVVLSLTDYGKQTYSKIIWDSKGVPYLTNDDEAAIYGVFRSLKSKTQVSVLAEYFFQRYNKDLKTFLQSFLNQNEFGNVATICNKLPIGITDNNGNIIK